jgi:hypothetical protein
VMTEVLSCGKSLGNLQDVRGSSSFLSLSFASDYAAIRQSHEITDHCSLFLCCPLLNHGRLTVCAHWKLTFRSFN